MDLRVARSIVHRTEGDPNQEIQAIFGVKLNQGDSEIPFRQLIQNIIQTEPERIKWGYVRLLNVHHHVYRIGAKAWEYNDDDVTVYCLSCHNDNTQ